MIIDSRIPTIKRAYILKKWSTISSQYNPPCVAYKSPLKNPKIENPIKNAFLLTLNLSSVAASTASTREKAESIPWIYMIHIKKTSKI